ncbi:MAG: YaiI/YqxD family protein [Desulfocapsaceae bacterium]
MKIWVDADACPVVIKEILYKAADRRGPQLTLVANSHFRIPKSTNISFLRVPQGQDVADNEIVNKVVSGDLVVTGDIPLAARIVEKGAFALNPRGEVYSEENIKERLSTRDFMDSLRSSGIETGGPPALGPRDKQAFANSLDQLLNKWS